MSVIAREDPTTGLTDEQIGEVVAAAADRFAPDGGRILVVIPDHTRTCPLPVVARKIHAAFAPRAQQVDFLIALGTHPALADGQIDRLLGVRPGGRGEVFPGSRVFNHRWDDPAALASLGTLPARRIDELTGGLFAMDVEVTINRLILDYDRVLICGPVFPHEVVGFSGGAKYFFPGICGEGMLNFFHWLGAVITCPRIIGAKDTPVRALLHVALDRVPVDCAALCMVVRGADQRPQARCNGLGGDLLAGLYFGGVREAWSAAADLSGRLHVVYVDRPFRSVLARAPEMYDELWVAAKCMYKMEPVVADGGELIIYAPHLSQISQAHGRIIEQIGYHTRDYFLARWDDFKHHPWGVIAHSTHVRGIGTYEDGVERPRIRVTLATAIGEAICRRIGLGYRDPASIDPADWQGREEEGLLYVPKAGEMLYKLRSLPAWQRLD